MTCTFFCPFQTDFVSYIYIHLLRHFNSCILRMYLSYLLFKNTRFYSALDTAFVRLLSTANDTTATANDTTTSVTRPDVFQRVMGRFPSGIQMAFAYGSGVFQQTGQDTSKNMLDFILVVDDPQAWHTQNLKLNRSHYSFLSRLGPYYISRIQEKYGAGIYFNTLVPFEDRLIKYGVISKSRLITDLLEWDTLYVSGRLHKPVKLIVLPKCQDVHDAMKYNLSSALHAAFLLLPESFKEEDLYKKIASLSYSGDFRMTFGEDKGKVDKLVMPNIPYFRKIYETFLDNHHVRWDRNTGMIEQSLDHMSQFHHLNLLPKGVQQGLLQQKTVPGRTPPDLEEVIWSLAHDWDCGEYVAKSVANIVTRSSWSQSIKGIFTAGVSKTVRYSCSKVKKMMKGMKLPEGPKKA